MLNGKLIIKNEIKYDIWTLSSIFGLGLLEISGYFR